jgi:hypothetical protein
VLAIGISGAVIYWLLFDLILGIPQPDSLLLHPL